MKELAYQTTADSGQKTTHDSCPTSVDQSTFVSEETIQKFKIKFKISDKLDKL